MRIYLPNESNQGIGGGWTFMRNLRDAMDILNASVEFVDNILNCDIMLICGATMIQQREVVKEAIELGKKIILRIDNIPRNSRNRNGGTTRLYDYAQWADWVVFQSQWAKKKILPLLTTSRQTLNKNNKELYGQGNKDFPDHFKEENSSVILNGVNTEIFTPDGPKIPRSSDIDARYLIVRYNRDGNKRLEEALDIYTEEYIKNNNIELFIIGQFSPNLIQAYFDFYLGERYRYFGIIQDRQELAEYYRSCDYLIYPSYSDACPNTVLEARACGLEVIHNGHAGIPEVMDPNLDISLKRMGREYLELFTKLWI